MQVRKQQLELDMEQLTGSKLGKEYNKAVYCYPAYLTYMQSASCEMPGWMNHELEFWLLGEISTTSDMQMIPLYWQKIKGNSRASWWGWKRRVKKVAWNSTLKKPKTMASGSITSWQTEGEKVEAVTDFISFGSKITVHDDYSHEIKRCMFLWRKSMTNLDSVLKSWDITLSTKVCLVKTMVFLAVMYKSESMC